MCRTSASRFLSGMAPSVLSQKAVRPQNGAICGRERRSFHEIACYQDFTKNNGLFSTKQQNSWKFCLPRADPHEICGRSARNLNINCPAVRQEALFTHGIDFCVLPCVRKPVSRTECLSDALPGDQLVLFTAWPVIYEGIKMRILIAPQARGTRLACFGTQLRGSLWKALLAAPDACGDAGFFVLLFRI